MTFNVVRALPDDSARLYQITIASKSLWNYSPEFMQKWAQVVNIPPEYIQANHVNKCMDQERAIAWYGLIERPGETLLDHLWVLPDETGKGAGRLLFEHAADFSRSLGARRMTWESDPNAVPFYLHLGGRVIGQAWTIMERHVPLMELDL